jgi:hypothetical protein
MSRTFIGRGGGTIHIFIPSIGSEDVPLMSLCGTRRPSSVRRAILANIKDAGRVCRRCLSAMNMCLINRAGRPSRIVSNVSGSGCYPVEVNVR